MEHSILSAPRRAAKHDAGRMKNQAELVRHALFAIREIVRIDEVQPGKNWLCTEVSNYWQQRKILIELLCYFSTMGLKVSHWRDEARAAQLLAGAVENDSI